jgi:hypothetical protein
MSLRDFFERDDHRLIHKWMHYFEIYESHFSKFRGKDIVLLEFGVLHGGSLQMWKEYFGSGSRIIGADINPRCITLEEDRIEIKLADQDSTESLAKLASDLPAIDIVIDDGGHVMHQQNNTFEVFWPKLKNGGIYLCEDTHTSYWPAFGGAFFKEDTFIERSKRLIDKLTAWHSQDPRLVVDEFTRSIGGMHFYDSVVVMDKKVVEPPSTRMKGVPSFPLTPGEQAVFDRR